MRFPFEPAVASVIFRADRPTGEWVLRRRALGGGRNRYELIQNGRLLMDTADGSSEEALARTGLQRCAGRHDLAILVGGLGFGFTLRAVLRDASATRVDVVELEPALVDLLGTAEVAAELRPFDLGDPRVHVEVGDVRAVLARAGGAYDCILLDVDNGPESLSAIGNGELYTEEGLRTCANALRSGGVLAVWSSEPAPAFLERMRAVLAEVAELIVPVERDGRLVPYRILSGIRIPPAAVGPC